MTPLEAALDYASRGWSVVPIIPGTKRPSISKWTELATTDTATINDWWGTSYPGHGVGIATGPASGIWVLDVDDVDALADLEDRHYTLPETMTSLTGSGGYHFLFTWPTDGRDIRNDAGRRLGPGLDVRGDGGQIVAPPTVHPTGVEYAWDAGQPAEPVDAPEWLLELVTKAPEVTGKADRIRLSQSDRPGDLWAAATSWEDILTADGWTFCYEKADGEQYWARPGKTKRQGASATTGYAGSDSLKVFTSSMRGWGLVEEEAYTKLGYLAATRFNSDHAAAATWLAGQGFTTMPRESITLAAQGDAPAEVAEAVAATINTLPDIVEADDSDTGWHRVDLNDILDGSYEPPTPTLLRRDDGKALIYPGRVHSIAGEPGGGKTWVALHLAAEVLADGGTAMLIDYEDRPDAAVSRLRALQVDTQAIRDRFIYIDPDGPLMDRQGRVNATALAILDAFTPDVAIIDSIGESIAVEGLNPNEDSDVAAWFRLLPRYMAKKGTAVVGLDHVTKSSENRGLWAIGSQRKLAAIDGAAYALEVAVAPTREVDGLVKLICAKDRHGTYQRGHQVATGTITNGDHGAVHVALQAPAVAFRPTVYMERVSRFLEMRGPHTAGQIETQVEGKVAHLRVAMDTLVREGYLGLTDGPRGAKIYAFQRPFTDEITIPEMSTQSEIGTTEMGDEVEATSSPPTDPSETTSSHLVPTSSPRQSAPRPRPGDEVAHDLVPSSPPLEGGDDGDEVEAPSHQGDDADDWLMV